MASRRARTPAPTCSSPSPDSRTNPEPTQAGRRTGPPARLSRPSSPSDIGDPIAMRLGPGVRAPSAASRRKPYKSGWRLHPEDQPAVHARLHPSSSPRKCETGRVAQPDGPSDQRYEHPPWESQTSGRPSCSATDGEVLSGNRPRIEDDPSWGRFGDSSPRRQARPVHRDCRHWSGGCYRRASTNGARRRRSGVVAGTDKAERSGIHR
jgi:hypothetical protein